MKKRENKTKYLMVIVAAAVCMLFLAGSLFFAFSVRQYNREQTEGYLRESTAQRQAAVFQKIDGDFQVLHGIAVTFANIELEDRQNINRILAVVNRGNDFIRMGLASPDGSVDLVDLDGTTYYDESFADLDFFQKALGGEDAVSGTISSVVNGEEVNYYAVPVWKGGKVVRVLCAVNPADALREIISVPVFRNEGYFAIADSQGVLVAPTIDPDPRVEIGASIFDFCEFEGDQRERIAGALQDGTGGSFSLFFNGVEQMLSVEPLDENDWSVLSVVPRTSIDSSYSLTSIGIPVVIVAASLIFIMLMLWQLHTLSKNQRQLERLAYTDPLTGINNYTRFLIEGSEMLEQNPDQPYAVWIYDIRKFTYINDIFGNTTGDDVLRRVAVLLTEMQGPGATMCRVSVDSFAGLRPYRQCEEIEAWFWQIVQRRPGQMIVSDQQMRIDSAMGYYCVDAFADKLSIEEMVNRATVAKRVAKEDTGNTVSAFTPDMSQRLQKETELEASGKVALENGEITFFLQPKVDIQHGNSIAGAEALARWRHPVQGWISPGEFVPLFERNGFIVQVDRSIFEQVCAWYVQAARAGVAPRSVSVNVSRQGILKEDLLEFYTGVKRRYGIADGVLELEFTESVMLSGDTFFFETVRDLREHGFICSIDDFGSGYSSLNVLKNLPIDVLKLDAGFFRNSVNTRREQVVAGGFLHIANQLRVHTVAEGVETVQQVEFLREHGCDMVQGFIFSRPVEQDAFAKLMQQDGGRLHVREP